MAHTTYTATLNIIGCARCHMDFGVTPQFERDRRKDHATFYCPRGHDNFYPQKSDEEKLRAELARTEGWLAEERQRVNRAESEARTAEYRRRAEKAARTRLKNRIAKGICPCCKRFFKNVHDHIADQHPEFVVPEDG